MKLKITLFTCLLSCVNLFAQNDKLPVIPKSGTTVQDFIPEGWDTLAQCTGDFNNDKQTDQVLVLTIKDEPDSSVTPRLLVILEKSSTGYTLKGYSATAIFCKSCGGIYGDPFQDITSKEKVITIHHYGGSTWRWAYDHKFRWQEGDWFLTGRSHYSYHLTEPCKTPDKFLSDYKEENLVTGDVVKKKIDKKCQVTETKKQVNPHPLKKLSEFDLMKDCKDNAID